MEQIQFKKRIRDINYLKKAILLARKYKFILAIDECYGDIYRMNKPKRSVGVGVGGHAVRRNDELNDSLNKHRCMRC